MIVCLFSFVHDHLIKPQNEIKWVLIAKLQVMMMMIIHESLYVKLLLLKIRTSKLQMLMIFKTAESSRLRLIESSSGQLIGDDQSQCTEHVVLFCVCFDCLAACAH